MTLTGTARGSRATTLPRPEQLVRRTIDGITAALGVRATLDWRVIVAPLANEPAHAATMARAAADLVGTKRVIANQSPTTGSTDVAFMLEKDPGTYIRLGIGETAELHNPVYAFNDVAIPYGSAFLAGLIEGALSIRACDDRIRSGSGRPRLRAPIDRIE